MRFRIFGERACGLLCVAWGARQPKFGTGSFAKRAVKTEGAVRLLREAVDHGQAEAAAFAELLGGEEWLHHFFEIVGSDSRPGVADGDQDVVAGAKSAFRGLELAVARPRP